MTRFVHLHTHSHYSLLDGLSNIKEMVDLAKVYDMRALALTDHGALYGAIDFFKRCKGSNIKPIIGLEAYMASGSRFDKKPGLDNKRFHLTLLAKNLTGYKNLVKLVSASHLEGYYYKPRIDKEILRECSEGLVCLSGCFGSELSRALRSKNAERAGEIIVEHQEIFGKENYFFEVMHHPNVEGLKEVTDAVVELSKKFNIPLVGTQDSHYLLKEDVKAHETLLAVQQNTDIDDTRRLSLSGDDFSFIDTPTAIRYFKNIPEAVENTEMVAEMCNIELPLGNWIFPDYQLQEKKTHDEELRHLVYKGFEFRNLEKKKGLVERVEYELKIITEKKFSPYFLVVADILRYARDNNILTNTRGSVAGSLASYLLGITNINPIEFKLPFERFLNPERPSPPDIDMDFADNRRDEVISYAKKKYGEDKVAQIGTFGTMMARGAVRDVARALGHTYNVGDNLARLIPLGSQGFPMTINRAMEITPELSVAYRDSVNKEIIDLARRLEGTARHVSIHAAGVVISPKSLSDLVPLQHDPKGERIITQYDMHAVEDIGLLKLDFLGIKNLTILGDAVSLVEKYSDKKVDIGRIPLDDKKTFEMLTRGETIGLFQLNGTGMTQYLKELKPTSINDINVMIALYRPGPMDNINEYIARKDAKKPIIYMHPKMKNFLDTTYGVLVYQDDLLMTAIEVAGYSWGEVDKFRKAVGKKIPAEMARQHVIFVERCQKHGGMTKEEAENTWRLFEPFQGYGFNKAHAASYGLVAYQTAFMKSHFPTEYMTAVLTADAGDVEKIAEDIAECKRMQILILPPDMNESFGNFTIIRKNDSVDQIRFGLYSIKNFGKEIADALISERKERGKFLSFSDFLERIQHKNLNKKSLEALICSGAMDSFGERGALLATVEDALTYNRSHKDIVGGQNSLFGLMENKESIPKLRLKDVPPTPKDVKLVWEKELLGLYISGHPLEKHKEHLEKLGRRISVIKKHKEGMTIIVGGIIEEVKAVLTSKGERMAFLKLADFDDSIECVVFPRTFNEYAEVLKTDKSIMAKGRISNRNGVQSLIIEKAKEL